MARLSASAPPDVKHDLPRLGPEEVGHARAGGLHGLLRVPPERVLAAGGIAEALREQGGHRLDDPRVGGGGRLVVEVDERPSWSEHTSRSAALPPSRSPASRRLPVVSATWSATIDPPRGTPPMSVTLTPKAAEKVRQLMAQPDQKEATGLRVRVVGGGCSGLSYRSQLERAAEEGDEVVESEGITIYVDPKSNLFVNGTTIDYHESMMGSGFAFENPNATGSCGCGSSFSA